MFYITGDTHGEFGIRLYRLDRFQPTRKDTLIVLGDGGVNYSMGSRDYNLKCELSNEKVNFFFVHGNHEERPYNIPSYHRIEYCGGIAYVEDEFPNLIFGKDGEIYDFDGKKTIVIGGAYSVDKYYRLSHGMTWFPSEQPDDTIKSFVEKKLDSVGWTVDVVLSHTVPLKYVPTERFISSIDQSTVDRSTEIWLDEIEERLDYKEWYAGHYHCSKKIDKLRIMFQDIRSFNEYSSSEDV